MAKEAQPKSIFYTNITLKNGWKAQLCLLPRTTAPTVSLGLDGVTIGENAIYTSLPIQMPEGMISENITVQTGIDNLPIGINTPTKLKFEVNFTILKKYGDKKLLKSDNTESTVSGKDLAEYIHDNIVYSDYWFNDETAHYDVGTYDPDTGIYAQGNRTMPNEYHEENLPSYNIWILKTNRGNPLYVDGDGNPNVIEVVGVQVEHKNIEIDLESKSQIYQYECDDAFKVAFEQWTKFDNIHLPIQSSHHLEYNPLQNIANMPVHEASFDLFNHYNEIYKITMSGLGARDSNCINEPNYMFQLPCSDLRIAYTKLNQFFRQWYTIIFNNFHNNFLRNTITKKTFISDILHPEDGMLWSDPFANHPHWFMQNRGEPGEGNSPYYGRSNALTYKNSVYFQSYHFDVNDTSNLLYDETNYYNYNIRINGSVQQALDQKYKNSYEFQKTLGETNFYKNILSMKYDDIHNYSYPSNNFLTVFNGYSNTINLNYTDLFNKNKFTKGYLFLDDSKIAISRLDSDSNKNIISRINLISDKANECNIKNTEFHNIPYVKIGQEYNIGNFENNAQQWEFFTEAYIPSGATPRSVSTPDFRLYSLYTINGNDYPIRLFDLEDIDNDGVHFHRTFDTMNEGTGLTSIEIISDDHTVVHGRNAMIDRVRSIQENHNWGKMINHCYLNKFNSPDQSLLECDILFKDGCMPSDIGNYIKIDMGGINDLEEFDDDLKGILESDGCLMFVESDYGKCVSSIKIFLEGTKKPVNQIRYE